ncbi:hypothetical protein [Nonomuraea recticatena]|uniref:hypothetical protein n=1 Tax=Nonomuraea recticatena TaxID=46178 RepID=UPI0036218536
MGIVLNTSRCHDPVTKAASTSACSTFFLQPSSSRGSSFIAASTRSASAVAPNSMTVVRVLRNPDTVEIFAASCARTSPSGSAPGGGTMSSTASAASRSCRRGTIASIDSISWSRRRSSPYSKVSNRVSIAAASVAECLASLGCWRARSLLVAVSAFPISSVVIKTSSRSRQSSTALPSK